jgi:transcriptional regulator with XRE-family HTH domain
MLAELSHKVLILRGMEPFSERLKKLRGALVSQQELAAKSGMTVSTISKLERGESNPSRRTIKRLAEALGIPENEMLRMAGFERAQSPRVAIQISRELYEKALGFAEAHGLEIEDWVAAAIEALMRLQGSPEESAKGKHIAGRIEQKTKGRLLVTPTKRVAAKNLDKEK